MRLRNVTNAPYRYDFSLRRVFFLNRNPFSLSNRLFETMLLDRLTDNRIMLVQVNLGFKKSAQRIAKKRLPASHTTQ